MRLLFAALLLTSCATPAMSAGKPLALRVTSASVVEGAKACVAISKSGGNGRSVTIMWATVPGTAKVGTDYVGSSGGGLVLGKAPVTVCADTIDNSTVDGTRAFAITSAVTSGTVKPSASGTVTLNDNDVAAPSPAPEPMPMPTPAGWLPSPSLAGVASIPSEFDPSTGIVSSYMPAPELDVGAFRFICGAGQLLYDDPIVYPGQPGKSHLHQFYGNLSANAFSTYESLRKGGHSNCSDPRVNAVNRSGYWMPALLDGNGNVIQPDFVSIYYKRSPTTDRGCQPPIVAKCLPLPNGLRYIFGRDMLNLSAPPTGNFHFVCDGKGGNFATMAEALKDCPVGKHLAVVGEAPGCWDGKYLDSPNHRDHVAYQVDTHNGYYACPTTHPYGIPGFSLAPAYRIEAGDDTSKWHFSSDEMAPGQAYGSTFHADWFGAWDDTVLEMWTNGCIQKKLSCAGGALGNGFSIIGADQPRYMINGVLTPSWTIPNRLVPIPPRP